MGNNRFEIFILSYNRPAELREAVASWLAETSSDVTLIVSDNSNDERVTELMRREFPQVQLRSRRPSLDPISHFNLCLAEASGEWFMLFHDDDLIFKDGFRYYRKAIDTHLGAVAIAGNSVFLRRGQLTSELLNNALPVDRVLRSSQDLVLGYLSPVSQHQPLASYLYSTSKVKGLSFNFRQGRKYCDLVFLSKVAARGDVVWLAHPVMATRAHGGNDSASHDIRAPLSVRRYLLSEGVFNRESEAVECYRMWNYLLHLRQRGVLAKPFQLRGRLAVIALRTAGYFIRHPLPLLAKLFLRLRFIKARQA